MIERAMSMMASGSLCVLLAVLPVAGYPRA